MTDKIINILIDAGLRRTEAKTLAYLFEKKSSYSVDIERNMDLRQPEVSQAMKLFLFKKWVTRKDIKHEGKGRPNVLYTLRSKKMVIDYMIYTTEKKIKELQKVLKNLKELKDAA